MAVTNPFRLDYFDVPTMMKKEFSRIHPSEIRSPEHAAELIERAREEASYYKSMLNTCVPSMVMDAKANITNTSNSPTQTADSASAKVPMHKKKLLLCI